MVLAIALVIEFKPNAAHFCSWIRLDHTLRSFDRNLFALQKSSFCVSPWSHFDKAGKFCHFIIYFHLKIFQVEKCLTKLKLVFAKRLLWRVSNWDSLWGAHTERCLLNGNRSRTWKIALDTVSRRYFYCRGTFTFIQYSLINRVYFTVYSDCLAKSLEI